MTYPPQPGQPDYGQQPGPYGTSPGGGFGQPEGLGQPAGFGQQPGAYPQSGAFGQQPYGQPYPGFDPAGGGNFPPPGQFGSYGPPSGGGGSKKGLWIGLSIGLVVILAALGITGFWKPGFFLGSKLQANAQTVAKQFVDGINKHDRATLITLKCPNAAPAVGDVIDGIAYFTDMHLDGVDTTGNQATVHVSMKTNGDSQSGTALLENQNGKWCWKDVGDEKGRMSSSSASASATSTSRSTKSSSSSSSSGGASDSGNYRTTAQEFINKINSGDSAGAMALVCQDSVSDVQSDVTKATSGGTNLSISSLDGDGNFSIGELDGTVNGEPIIYGSIGTDDAPDGGACVDLFTVD